MWKTPGNGLNTRFFAENRLHIAGNFAISQNGIAKFFARFRPQTDCAAMACGKWPGMINQEQVRLIAA
jgi:hypothetical protein